MNTLFPTQQWEIVPDTTGHRLYANVDNAMDVQYNEIGFELPIAVPTGLFTLMKDVLNVSNLETVKLYLDYADDGWVFGLELDGGDTIVDLWRYSGNNPPMCVSDYLLKYHKIRL